MKPLRLLILTALAVFVLWNPNAARAGAEPREDSIIQTYQKAVSVDPNDVIAHYNLGLAYYKLERWEESRQELEKCIRLNPQDSRTHAQVDGVANQILGVIYYSRLKNDDRAIEYFQASIKFQPKDGDTYFALGLAQLRRKAFPAAIQAFQQTIACGRSKDTEVMLQLARAYVESGNDPEAIATYQKILALQPDFKTALEDLALIYHRHKSDDDAIRVLEHLVAVDPNNFNANYLLGLHYYQKKKYPEMVTAFNHAVAVKPDLADAHYNLGMAYFYQARYDLAVDSLKKAVTLNPKDVEAYNLLGQAQTAAVEIHLQQGSTCISQDRFNEATEEFQKVLSIDPENHKAKLLLEDSEQKIKELYAAHMNLADKFFREGRLEDSFNEYEQASKLAPESVQAREGMQKTRFQIDKLLASRVSQGKAAEKLKDFREARRQYESALQLKPGYAAARNALNAMEESLKHQITTAFKAAERAAQTGDRKTASARYQDVIKLADNLKRSDEWQAKATAGLARVNSQQADTMRQLLDEGRAAMQNGENDKAKRLFTRVLEIEPQNKVANDFIMKLTGSQSQVKVTAELVKSTYYQGVDFYVKGKIEEAIQEWEKVIQLDPENQDARINIERAKAKLVAIRKLTAGQ
jgi:tetratricopeptide (TPR) repeat protein